MLKPCMCVQEAGSFWVENAEWIFPLIVTIIFAIISWRYEKYQKQLAEYEVGISLMEKRMMVYDVTRKVLEEISAVPEQKVNSAVDFSKTKRVAKMLFGAEITALVDSVSELINEVHRNNSLYTYEPGGMPISAASLEKRTEYAKKACSLLDQSDQLFARYIDYSNIGLIKKKFRKK